MRLSWRESAHFNAYAMGLLFRQPRQTPPIRQSTSRPATKLAKPQGHSDALRTKLVGLDYGKLVEVLKQRWRIVNSSGVFCTTAKYSSDN